MEPVKLRVLDIIAGTSVDGPGLRTSVYFAGCAHHCPGCHNPQSWDFDGGREMTLEEVVEVVEENGFNVTFSGGDPLYQLPGVTELAAELSRRGYTIWCYTGFSFEEVRGNSEARRLLGLIDVMVDGMFVADLRDTSLCFRGSSNQRLVDVRRSMSGEIAIWSD